MSESKGANNIRREENELDSAETDSACSEESIYNIQVDENMQKRIAAMSEEDFNRYETFRCSNFPKGTIKKLINTIIGQAVNPNIIIAIGGISKVFIGEMIEEAKAVQSELNENGPLLPSHIHEAYRRLYNKMPNLQMRKNAPWD